MLAELTVKNIALIDALTISFEAGANIMTGETGAGKSILVGALGLLMGRKATADIVRAGANEAEVSAIFEIEDLESFEEIYTTLGLEAQPELILRRVVSTSGRSRAYVNGSPVPLAQLAAVGEQLISISGQHDQQNLLRTANQLRYLDLFGQHKFLLDEMRLQWQKFNIANEELEKLEGRLKEAEEKRELYVFQRDEIKKVNPLEGEDDELLAEKNQNKNSSQLLEFISEAAEVLGGEPGNVVEKLSRVRRLLENSSNLAPQFEDKYSILDDCYHQLADLAVELESAGGDLDSDPKRLEWVDERLNTLAKLKRKYNLPLSEIIAQGHKLEKILNELDGAGLDLAKLRRQKNDARENAITAAQVLHEKRLESSKRLTTLLVDCLRSLGFPKLEIHIEIDAPKDNAEPREIERRLGPLGFDKVEFLFCPNKGEGLKALAKIASGGELSRLMLALKAVAERPEDQILVFDEIDTGLGGITAEAVAAKMSELGERQQLVVITHLPQMAALKGKHFLVSKEGDEEEGRTKTSITALSTDERVLELSRMLGGASPTKEATALARQLLA